jgi:DNA mismatch endonuclease (patch repair protein)
MADVISKEHRSWNMSRIRSANTAPELIVRSQLHKMGCRFRLHRPDLPGRPDIVLPSRKMALFVHGCFWHQHPKCKFATTPKSNKGHWTSKFKKTRSRDKANLSALKQSGWKAIVIWECETKDPAVLKEKLKHCLSRTDKKRNPK